MAYAHKRTPTQNRGMGDYEQPGDWSWLYYPPPYDFLAPSDSAPLRAPVLGSSGLGCSEGCGCSGSFYSPQATGLGLFESMDPSSWGVGEWSVVAVGGYLAVSVVNDVTTLGKETGKKGKKAYRRTKKGAQVAGGIAFGSLLLTAGLAAGAYYLWSQMQQGLGAYMPQDFVTPQVLVDPVNSPEIAIPPSWGMGAYERQSFVTPQVLRAPLVKAVIRRPAGW